MAVIMVSRNIISDVLRGSFILSRTPKLVRIPSASMTSKENRDPNVKKPAPWPYKTKKFTFWKTAYEGTVKRFDENTKVVVVDGNIGAGKSAFAKQLAEAFDFVHFPEPTMERYFVSSYGYDIRKIDELLPPSFKCCDVSTFYANPYHQNVPKFQMLMFMFRLEQYVDALAHVLNTGQGVVLERSVFGDFVFAETMAKFGYLSPRDRLKKGEKISHVAKSLDLNETTIIQNFLVMNYYKDVNKNTLEELLRPHLIVYLDITPEVALERIKKRNDPTEVNSKVLTKEYLATIEHFYKKKYLKSMQKHAEVLVYDWNNYGDVEVVVEDIERIDFERYTKYDAKMKDWRKSYDWEWGDLRRFYTNEKTKIVRYAYINRPSVTELCNPGEEIEQYEELMLKIPGERYIEGFNPDCGDKVWFKTNSDSYWKSILYRLGN